MTRRAAAAAVIGMLAGVAQAAEPPPKPAAPELAALCAKLCGEWRQTGDRDPDHLTLAWDEAAGVVRGRSSAGAVVYGFDAAAKTLWTVRYSSVSAPVVGHVTLAGDTLTETVSLTTGESGRMISFVTFEGADRFRRRSEIESPVMTATGVETVYERVR